MHRRYEVQAVHIENEQWCTPQGCDSQAVEEARGAGSAQR